jgi:hypothetical protein
MKKMLLGIVILLTLANLAGVAYASVCETSGGARVCGSRCSSASEGRCVCDGTCTADELNWVAGAKKSVAEMEVLDY